MKFPFKKAQVINVSCSPPDFEYVKDNPLTIYVCPKCKSELQQQSSGLYCLPCHRTYPLTNEIPDFLLLRPEESANPFLRNVKRMDKLAWIYETKLWYSIIIKLFVGGSVNDFISYACEKMSPIKGLVLDVATGTGVYGRRVAGDERIVYGIDISLGMLHKGQVYAEREGVTNMYFSRADVEFLPFSENTFDSCFVCGSLHLFPDTHKALIEIGRTLKSGALVCIQTFTRGFKTGIMKYEWIRRRLQQQAKFFDIPILQKMIDETGFERLEQKVQGASLWICARKR